MACGENLDLEPFLDVGARLLTSKSNEYHVHMTMGGCALCLQDWGNSAKYHFVNQLCDYQSLFLL